MNSILIFQGCDATSNLLAGKLYHIPVRGTHAHSFVNSFASDKELKVRMLAPASPADRQTPGESALTEPVDFYSLSKKFLDEICTKVPKIVRAEVSEGELVSFCAYAIAFPRTFLSLIDTYDVLKSGTLNFCACALALWQLGYKAVGVRIDSGDLAYLSKEVRRILQAVSEQ